MATDFEYAQAIMNCLDELLELGMSKEQACVLIVDRAINNCLVNECIRDEYTDLVDAYLAI